MMMNKNTPFVIFNIKGFQYNDLSTENSFYRCQNNENFISYISRQSAISETNIAEKTSLELLPARSFLGYMNNRKGSTGIFNADGELSKRKLDSLIEKLQNTKSNVWTSVISFTPEFSAKLCNDKEQAQDLINENLKYLFEHTQLDYNNIEWAGAYHTNTDNRHIHLLFFEKNPINLDSNGNKKYVNKICLPKENIANFKYNIAKNYNEKNSSYYNLRDKTRYGISNCLKTNKQLLGLIYNKSQPIIEGGIYQYARLSNENKKIIEGIVNDIITINPEINSTYNEYKNNLAKEQANILSIYKNNNTNAPIVAKNFYSSRINEFNNRLCNEVLKVIKTTHNQKLPYINYKNNLGNSLYNSAKLLRNKNFLDISSSISNNIVKTLQQSVKDYSYSLTDEAYIYRKKLEGEIVNE